MLTYWYIYLCKEGRMMSAGGRTMGVLQAVRQTHRQFRVQL